MNPWRSERVNATWYVFRDGFRVVDSFIVRSQEEASATVDALNMIADGAYITVALTPTTSMLYIPRSDGT